MKASFRYLKIGYDKWYQSCVDYKTPAQLEQSLLMTSMFQIFAKIITLLLFFGSIKFYCLILFSF
jgi:antibiotic biosynthesis monooxygenase (ABM) superfamily enzyme